MRCARKDIISEKGLRVTPSLHLHAIDGKHGAGAVDALRAVYEQRTLEMARRCGYALCSQPPEEAVMRKTIVHHDEVVHAAVLRCLH
jgi:hypothetical protein